MLQPRILIVDDDPTISKLVRANLEARKYKTLTAADGAEALQIVERELPDLVILDILMPNMDGFEVCRQLRKWTQIPIIMLGERGDESDRVKCLDLGADAYLTKPFGVEELIAWVQAILRRTTTTGVTSTQSSYKYNNIIFNFTERRVTVAGRQVTLTPKEYHLLRELVLNANNVLTYSMLLGKIWGPEHTAKRKYLRVFIHRLRKAIEPDLEKPVYILTVPGVGYSFKGT